MFLKLYHHIDKVILKLYVYQNLNGLVKSLNGFFFFNKLLCQGFLHKKNKNLCPGPKFRSVKQCRKLRRLRN